MPCDNVQFGDTSAIVCSRNGRAPQRCVICNALAGKLCDGPSKDARRKTCDAPICSRCATHSKPDHDLCPSCAEGVTAEHVQESLWNTPQGGPH